MGRAEKRERAMKSFAPFCALLTALLAEASDGSGLPHAAIFAAARGAVDAGSEAHYARSVIETLIAKSDAALESGWFEGRSEKAEAQYKRCKKLLAAYPVPAATI